MRGWTRGEAVLLLVALARLLLAEPDRWFARDVGEAELLALSATRLDNQSVDINTLWIDTPYGQAGARAR